MWFINATNINRKSGGAKPRDLQFRGPFLEMFSPKRREHHVRLSRKKERSNSALSSASSPLVTTI
jgi:hypothetical protein